MTEFAGIMKRPDGEWPCFYYPQVFTDVVDIEHAKRLTVTQEGDLASAVRWEVETKFVIDTLLSFVTLNYGSRVLDYGCGIGRLAKALMERANCSVTGVDMSAKMRALAIDYVGLPRFSVCTSEALWRLTTTKFDCAIAAWVLPHCLFPAMDLELIAEVLKPRAHLLVLNSYTRRLPVRVAADGMVGWMDDGLDIRQLTLKHFEQVQLGTFTVPELANLNECAYWAVYQSDAKSRDDAL